MAKDTDTAPRIARLILVRKIECWTPWGTSPTRENLGTIDCEHAIGSIGSQEKDMPGVSAVVAGGLVYIQCNGVNLASTPLSNCDIVWACDRAPLQAFVKGEREKAAKAKADADAKVKAEAQAIVAKQAAIDARAAEDQARVLRERAEKRA